jgi:hypothetical protein
VGLDFIRATTPSFNRMLDRRLVEMRSPKLFTLDMPIVSRSASADICGGAKVAAGEKILLRLIKGRVRANEIVDDFEGQLFARQRTITTTHTRLEIGEGQRILSRAILYDSRSIAA